MQHLDDGSLQAWLDRTRSDTGAADLDAIGRHIERCERCAKRAGELSDVTRRAGTLLSAWGDEDVPDFEGVLRRARALRSRGRRSGARTAMAWAASVAVALGVGWLGSDLYRSGLGVPGETGQRGGGAVGEAGPSPTSSAVDAVARARPAAESVSRPASPVLDAPTDPRSVEVAEGREGGDAAGPRIVRGRVVDAVSGAPIRAAQVYVADLRVGTLTGPDGAFQLSLGEARGDDAERDVTLTVELIGYGRESRDFAPRPGDTVLEDFRLSQVAVALDEIVVTGTAAGGGYEWRAVSRSEAEAEAGFRVYTVPELDVLGIEIGAVDGLTAVRVRQRLAPDVELTLIQSRGRLPTDAGDAAHGRLVATTRRADVSIIGLAPVAADSLRALLDRVR